MIFTDSTEAQTDFNDDVLNINWLVNFDTQYKTFDDNLPFDFDGCNIVDNLENIETVFTDND